MELSHRDHKRRSAKRGLSVDSENNNPFYLIQKGIKDHWKKCQKGSWPRKIALSQSSGYFERISKGRKGVRKKLELLGVTWTRKINDKINNRGPNMFKGFCYISEGKKSRLKQLQIMKYFQALQVNRQELRNNVFQSNRLSKNQKQLLAYFSTYSFSQ